MNSNRPSAILTKRCLNRTVLGVGLNFDKKKEQDAPSATK